MNSRVSDERVQAVLEIHRMLAPDGKACNCEKCRALIDLLDARKQIAEQAEEIERLRSQIASAYDEDLLEITDEEFEDLLESMREARQIARERRL